MCINKQTLNLSIKQANTVSVVYRVLNFFTCHVADLVIIKCKLTKLHQTTIHRTSNTVKFMLYDSGPGIRGLRGHNPSALRRTILFLSGQDCLVHINITAIIIMSRHRHHCLRLHQHDTPLTRNQPGAVPAGPAVRDPAELRGLHGGGRRPGDLLLHSQVARY